MKSTRTAALALALISIGCTEGPPPRSGAVVRDSAGVGIVENDAPAWGAGEAWRISDTPRLRIGAVEGNPDRQLFEVEGAHRFDGGRIVVANRGTSELRFFAPDGGFLSATGREGEGPGEFRFLDELYVVGDSLYAYDRSLERISVMTSDGRFTRSFRPPTLGDGPPSRPVGWFDDGTFLARAFPAFWTHPETGFQRFQDNYLIVDGGGAILDTLGERPGEETYIHIQDDGVMAERLPFARTPVSAVGAEAFFYGANEAYRIDQYSRDGRLVRSIRLAREARTPTAGDVEAFIGDLQAQIPEQAREGIAVHYRSMPLGDAFPFYSDLRVDTEGHLWVEDYLALPIKPSSWAVFDPDGRFLGSVTLPARFTPYQIGSDFILGRWEDELEVEYVDVFDLTKTPLNQGKEQ